jgi:hypothetical protein
VHSHDPVPRSRDKVDFLLDNFGIVPPQNIILGKKQETDLVASSLSPSAYPHLSSESEAALVFHVQNEEGAHMNVDHTGSSSLRKASY